MLLVCLILIFQKRAIALANEPVEYRVTFYGWEDNYTGRTYPGAYLLRDWPKRCCPAPYLGIAVSDRSIEIGTRLCLEITDLPSWADSWNLDKLFGRTVCGTVVDYMDEDLPPDRVDCWPQTWKQLVGEETFWIGVVYAKASTGNLSSDNLGAVTDMSSRHNLRETN